MTIDEFVIQEVGGDRTGHDYRHALRVKRLALELAKEHGGDERICHAASLLHDCADEKLFVDLEKQKKKIAAVLAENGYSPAETKAILTIIDTIPFHKEKDHPLTEINAQIVSDADKLEAIGAIGVIRAIEYGASKGRPFYEDKNLETIEGDLQFKEESPSTLSHFYEKLLRLGDHFYTPTAKKKAEPRLQFIRLFLREFYSELVD